MEQLLSPPREFSLMPFWFWNDDLSDKEILRQIADFDAHGVYGFVIHPRVGLPRSIEFMSDAMLRFMDVAIREAVKRDMKVILYDEGMYPSGSASGQVVATNPQLACRCLAMKELTADTQPELPAGQNLVATMTTASGKRIAVIDRRVDSTIRGLHYIGEGPKEDAPPAGDILNPETARTIIQLVHEKYHAAFKEHFGKTIIAVFTDEPNTLGRVREKNVKPGTSGILEHVNRLLGYDFTPHLPALWFDDEPDAKRYRRDYDWAIHRRLEESWYAPLSTWCGDHGVLLCGHPDRGDEIGVQKYFLCPGQDVVWRFIEPDKASAIEGAESTNGKCTSSAMIHYGRRRNNNEFCGAYGHQTTFEEVKWLADWLLVRGVNLLIPHAFYYSIRGPRKDERPPQLGPFTPQWDHWKPFADHCRRLAWINTDSKHVCDIAILAHSDHCPWPAAKVLFERQRDFNYLDVQLLGDLARIDEQGVHVGGMTYPVLIIDGFTALDDNVRKQLEPMTSRGHIISFKEDLNLTGAATAKDAGDLIARLDALRVADVVATPATADLRIRHMIKEDKHFYLLFNEAGRPLTATITTTAKGAAAWIDTASGESTPIDGAIKLEAKPYQLSLLMITPGDHT